MPILFWIALWSGMTGVAQIWQDNVLPAPLRTAKDRRADRGNRPLH